MQSQDRYGLPTGPKARSRGPHQVFTEHRVWAEFWECVVVINGVVVKYLATGKARALGCHGGTGPVSGGTCMCQALMEQSCCLLGNPGSRARVAKGHLPGSGQQLCTKFELF